jgi:hypothetical protein
MNTPNFIPRNHLLSSSFSWQAYELVKCDMPASAEISDEYFYLAEKLVPSSNSEKSIAVSLTYRTY